MSHQVMAMTPQQFLSCRDVPLNSEPSFDEIVGAMNRALMRTAQSRIPFGSDVTERLTISTSADYLPDKYHQAVIDHYVAAGWESVTIKPEDTWFDIIFIVRHKDGVVLSKEE